MSLHRHHIPYLGFHKAIIREICRPQKDDLLILAKGLGMRRIICALLKTYDRKEDLVLVVNASPADEAGIGDELGIMGVRDPGFRILTYEMSIQQREEMYRHGGLFSVTSKILVNDLLKGTVPAKLITGLVILHAEKVAHGSQEEFAIRLFRRENQSGFCKAFSDEPESFAHGISPLKDMLINLNMNSVMIWPRYNDAVKVALATRQAEVVEMYQPMTDLMRQCQDAITECMEAMLVELKRDHSLNLDLEDLNVRNAQFKSFDTIVRIKLRPVWHKVGQKTKVHVQALTELRNLHTWLLEYDSATFASYINTLQRQHFISEKLSNGASRHMHDWFNAKAAALLVEASQARISKRKAIMDNEPEENSPSNEINEELPGENSSEWAADEEALRDAAMDEALAMNEAEENDAEVMEAFEQGTQVMPSTQRPALANGDDDNSDNDEDELQAVPEDAPPVFRPLVFQAEGDLTSSVQRRMRKGHEPVLEELPKWGLLARVLKEIEDTIARVAESHADAPGTNTVLIMTSSDRVCLQLRQYLSTMLPPASNARGQPPPHAGRKMMQTLFLSNWQHEKNGERLNDPARMRGLAGGDEVKVKKGEMETKLGNANSKNAAGAGRGGRGGRGGAGAGWGTPSYKRRRIRGGGAVNVGRRETRPELSHKEAMMRAQNAFGGGEDGPANGGTGFHGIGNGGPPANDGRTVDPSTALLSQAGVIEEEELRPGYQNFLAALGLLPEDFDVDYGLLPPEDTVIIRPYGGEDDDILLQELRPRFVVMYEPNLAFIRRLEVGYDPDIWICKLMDQVYKNCNPGLALRVYQMMYTNSFEEDRFLSTMSREAEAFKKLIDDRQSMVIPIYNNNPRAPMRDNVTRSKTTYSSRNAGGGEASVEQRIIVDIREMGALLPSLIDAAGIKVIPATLTVGDYILTPTICVERKSLPDLEASLNNGRLYGQCESMTAQYDTCILLIEFEDDRFGLRSRLDAQRESNRGPKEEEDWFDIFYLQSKLCLLALQFPSLRIVWSSSPHESVKVLGDLKLNHNEPDEMTAMLKGTSENDRRSLKDGLVENAAAVEMLRCLPGINSFNIRKVLAEVEGMNDLVKMKQKELCRIIGEEEGKRCWEFMHSKVSR